jgi:DNA-directed RNA polymerase specialized sigma24 family protein
LETGPNPDFRELTVRLAGYGLRVFSEYRLGGSDATVSGVGLSVEDFVSEVLLEFAEGRLAHEASRGELFSLLATALRNDIVDALRKAAHAREESRSALPRDGTSEGQPPGLDELPARTSDFSQLMDAERYRQQVQAAFVDEPELAEVVNTVLDHGFSKPQEIAEALGISTTDYQNRKKRLRRRLIEYRLVEVRDERADL